MADLEIIGLPLSNYVWTCRIAAAEKGVPYKLTPARPHSPEIDCIHPFGKMPAMHHGDVELFESKAICSYIDAAFPGPSLIPRQPAAMAKTEQWISCVNTTIDPLLVRQYILGYAFPRTPDGGPDRKRIDAALVNMPAQFAVLEKAVASGHLVGNSFTLADMNLVPIVYYLTKFPESAEMMAKSPALTRYLERHMKRESVQTSVPLPPKA
jgi:glutathione S-transferase